MAWNETGRPVIVACVSPRKSVHGWSISNASSKATRASSAAMARMRVAGTPQRAATASGVYRESRYLSAISAITVRWVAPARRICPVRSGLTPGSSKGAGLPVRRSMTSSRP